MRARFSLLWLSVLVMACGLSTAQANLKLCNETSYVLQVAAAYQQGVASKAEGWINVLPGQCKNALDDLPNNAQAFVFAKSDVAHIGDGLVFDGSERFCVGADNARFTVEGRRDCRRRGYVEADLAQVTTNSGRRTVTFTEKNDYGRRRARTAGLQRLLSDLQYDIGTIDGFGGARTRETEAAYKLRYGIPAATKGTNLLDKLVRTVRNAARERGLTLCNKTNHLVWVATGMLKDDNFESRGWARLLADSCAQVYSQNLTDRFYFYYAEAVDAQGNTVIEAGRRKVWGGDITLCTKSTRFVIHSNEACRARGFDQHGFIQLDTGTAPKWTVNLE